MDIQEANMLHVVLVFVGAAILTGASLAVLVRKRAWSIRKLLPICLAVVFPCLLLIGGFVAGEGVMPFVLWVAVIALLALLGALLLVVDSIRRALKSE